MSAFRSVGIIAFIAFATTLAQAGQITDAVICRSVSAKGQAVSPAAWFPDGTTSIAVWFRASHVPPGAKVQIRWLLNGTTLKTREITLRPDRPAWDVYELAEGEALPRGTYEAIVKVGAQVANTARVRVGGEEPVARDAKAIVPTGSGGASGASGLSRRTRTPGAEAAVPGIEPAAPGAPTAPRSATPAVGPPAHTIQPFVGPETTPAPATPDTPAALVAIAPGDQPRAGEHSASPVGVARHARPFCARPAHRGRDDPCRN